MTAVHTINVGVAPETAFAFIALPTNEATWNPGVARSTQSAAGPVGVGATFETVGRTMGREVTISLEVVEFDPPRRTSTRARSGPMSFNTTYEVQPAPTGATVAMRVEVVATGVLNLLRPLFQAAFERRLQRLMPNLKQAIERSAPPSVAASS
jgi:hypothetical protein